MLSLDDFGSSVERAATRHPLCNAGTDAEGGGGVKGEGGREAMPSLFLASGWVSDLRHRSKD
jgi:hypothetical protein